MRSPAFPPRRPSHLVRYIVPAVVLVCLLYYLSRTGPETPTAYLSTDGSILRPAQSLPYKSGTNQDLSGSAQAGSSGDKAEKPIEYDSADKDASHTQSQAAQAGSSIHPIDSLIKVADASFNDMLAKQSHTLEEAAAAYRKRRGRHPPPGFREWYNFAAEHNAVVVEDFWDQIYHDLNPFWGMDNKIMRKEAWDFEMTINVRNGNASAKSDWFWTQIWLKMIKTIEVYLPDMDIALNAMDEPRLVVPWEDISAYMEKEKKSRVFWPPKQVVSEFDTLPTVKTGFKKPATQKKYWEHAGEYPWTVLVRHG